MKQYIPLTEGLSLGIIYKTMDIEEKKEKERRVKELLEKEGLDALLLNKQHNFAWFTGGGRNYVFTGTERGAVCLLLTRKEKILIANNIEAPRILEEEIEKDEFDLREFGWHQNQKETIESFIKGKRVGSDDGFPGTINISTKIDSLRCSLTSSEVERYRQLGKTLSIKVEKVCQEIKSGDKENEIAGRTSDALLSEGILPIVLLIAADERIEKFRHPLPTDKKIAKYVMVVVCGRKWGLIVSLTRLVYFGKVPLELRKKHEAVTRIDTVLIANTLPGKPFAEILQKGIQTYQETGFPQEWQNHHQGGPTGYQPRDYKVTLKEKRKVEPSQAVAWNPSIRGTKSEDTIIALPAGPEIISSTSSWPKLKVSYQEKTWERPDILEK
ncbi:MAG: aminopeptidase P family N-terminal domain-containing protein [Candidatus Omnitrophica bacterium]|nr:aminopeptidase P family N-terminal domain-containing protein [Candidatus Omnitrophota bacterium]